MSAMNMNLNLYRESLAQNKKPVLVEYSAPWCGYCRRIAPAFGKVADQYADRLIVGVVDIDQEPEIARENSIEVIPTLILYKNGKPVDHIVAPDSKAKIDAFITPHL